jgi:hypothetical protein
MTMLRVWTRTVVAGVFGLLAACDDHHHHAVEYDEDPYIWWEGSANGQYVVDGTDDFFLFLSDGGYLAFGHTTYWNVFVTSHGDLIWDDALIGAVELVESEQGEPVAALIGLDGHFLDLYGPEDDLHWQETDLDPIFIWDAAALTRAARGAPALRQGVPGVGPPNAVAM